MPRKRKVVVAAIELLEATLDDTHALAEVLQLIVDYNESKKKKVVRA